jgi:hypothetical protein
LIPSKAHVRRGAPRLCASPVGVLGLVHVPRRVTRAGWITSHAEALKDDVGDGGLGHRADEARLTAAGGAREDVDGEGDGVVVPT